MTDLKSWRVRYTPEPTWRGRSVGTHAGFLKAWTHAGFNDRVLARLRAVEREQPEGAPPLRIWVTGAAGGGLGWARAQLCHASTLLPAATDEGQA